MLMMADQKGNDMKNEIKANLIKLEQLEKIADHAEADYQREPENVEYEETFDLAYKNKYNVFMLVASQISEFAGIDIKAARAMVQGKREELKKILA